MNSTRYVITAGEPAGIGPDIIIQSCHNQPESPYCNAVVLGDADVFQARAKQLNLNIRLIEADQPIHQKTDIPFIHMPCAAPVETGVLNPNNAEQVLQLIEAATLGCLEGDYSGMITAPVHKGIINQAGIRFSGHTELIANLCQIKQAVMMLASEQMRVCLATTHVPLQEVSQHISRESLTLIIRIIHQSLQQCFAIESPQIAVLGLNPHAGEQGYLGREEIETIEPVINTLNAEGFNTIGPLPADTAFTPDYLASTDVFLAMYHDQGLPVIKHTGFGKMANITLGLPIIRTSVDHGTALDLAGSGNGRSDSFIYALNYAKNLTPTAHETPRP